MNHNANKPATSVALPKRRLRILTQARKIAAASQKHVKTMTADLAVEYGVTSQDVSNAAQFDLLDADESGYLEGAEAEACPESVDRNQDKKLDRDEHGQYCSGALSEGSGVASSFLMSGEATPEGDFSPSNINGDGRSMSIILPNGATRELVQQGNRYYVRQRAVNIYGKEYTVSEEYDREKHGDGEYFITNFPDGHGSIVGMGRINDETSEKKPRSRRQRRQRGLFCC
ncbi:unnamed protein product [Amoebophrya sp. A120]|nr:unnamed protein product [Amoebophrya sp. A120]|eukprot:GSA120T00018252001.1